MKLVSGNNDPKSGLVSMFLNFGSEPIIIYRHDSESLFDRSTGKYKRSFNIINSCAIPRPKKSRDSSSSNGVEISSGDMELIIKDPIYGSDQRDNASADIVFARSSYWKVLKVTDYCGYSKALMKLMPEDECKGVRGILGS